jgi:D-alanyl-D-alanine carboxypeptidase
MRRGRGIGLTLGIAAFVVVSTGCGGESGAPAALERPDLQRKLERLGRVGPVGAVALLRTPAGEWRGAMGQAAGGRQPTLDDRFAIASTTKTYVAAVVLQLVGEGRLSLATTASSGASPACFVTAARSRSASS